MCASACPYIHTYMCVESSIERILNRIHNAVLGIRSKWWMDKCPSIIILAQTISVLLGHIVEDVQMCHSRCATVDVPQ
jgi:hypothetical protein